MIIYLLTFYLFGDIEKNIGITHANHSARSKAILTKMTKMHMQPERLYFLFLFIARQLSMVIVVIEKHQKQLFYSNKTPLSGR